MESDEKDVMYKLGAIEAYLKSIGDKLDKSIEDNKTIHTDHDKRIGELERGQTKIFTLHGLVSFFISLAVGLAGYLWPK